MRPKIGAVCKTFAAFLALVRFSTCGILNVVKVGKRRKYVWKLNFILTSNTFILNPDNSTEVVKLKKC